MVHYLSRLQEATRKFWDKPALNTLGGESFTYCQMSTLIEKFHIFFDQVIGKDRNVAIWAKNSARWGMSFFAVNTYGAVAVPLLADFTPDTVIRLINHSECTVVLTNADKWKHLDPASMPEVRVAIDVDNLKILYCSVPEIEEHWNSLDEKFAEKYPDGFSPDDVHYPSDNFDDLAVISYTSGSTGDPKGVMLTYRNFSATVDFSQAKRPTSEHNKMVSMLPMAHMYGLVTEFIYPLCFGTSIYWMAKAPTPAALLNAFQQVKPYQLITVPLVMEKIFKLKIKPVVDKPMMKVLCSIPLVNRIIFNKIRRGFIDAFGGNITEIILGGAPVNPEVEKWFKRIRLPYMVGYGMTEATPLIAYESAAVFVPGSCGKPVSCTTVRIDSTDPHTVPGEIQAKGDNICIGYYKNPEATAAAFTDDGFLRTGDLGIIDKDGNIFIKGRSKCMFLGPSGQNIYPEELEAFVNCEPFVVESVVVDRGGRIVALVYVDKAAVAREGVPVDQIPERIKAGANRHLPGYSKIAAVEVVDEPFEKTPKMSIKRFLYK